MADGAVFGPVVLLARAETTLVMLALAPGFRVEDILERRVWTGTGFRSVNKGVGLPDHPVGVFVWVVGFGVMASMVGRGISVWFLDD